MGPRTGRRPLRWLLSALIVASPCGGSTAQAAERSRPVNSAGQDDLARLSAKPAVWANWSAKALASARAFQITEQEKLGTPSRTVPALDAEVQRILTRLEPHVPGGRVPNPVIVEDCPQYNASAMRSGYVRICRAVFAKSETEDAVAFVIAHELSHYIRRDFDAETAARSLERLAGMGGIAAQRMIETNSADTFQANLKTGATNPVDEVGGMAIERLVKRRNGTKHELETLAAVIAISVVANQLATSSLARMLPAQERAADRLAIDLIVRAGYNPQAATEALENSSEDRLTLPDDPFDVRGVILARRTPTTHPEVAERLESLRAYIAKHHGRADILDRQGTPLPWLDPAEDAGKFDDLLKLFDNDYRVETALLLAINGRAQLERGPTDPVSMERFWRICGAAMGVAETLRPARVDLSAGAIDRLSQAGQLCGRRDLERFFDRRPVVRGLSDKTQREKVNVTLVFGTKYALFELSSYRVLRSLEIDQSRSFQPPPWAGRRKASLDVGDLILLEGQPAKGIAYAPLLLKPGGEVRPNAPSGAPVVYPTGAVVYAMGVEEGWIRLSGGSYVRVSDIKAVAPPRFNSEIVYKDDSGSSLGVSWQR